MRQIRLMGMFLVLLTFAASFSRAQTITTFAGTYGMSTYSGDGVGATAATVGTPNGVAVDALGNVYFTDGTNNVIRKVDLSGLISTVVGSAGTGGYGGDGGPASTATINNPVGIWIDRLGNIIFCDNGNYIVRKVLTSGIITTIAGIPDSGGTTVVGGAATATKLAGAEGIVSDANGKVYFSDSHNEVFVVDTSGNINLFAGGTSGYRGDGGAATMASLLAPAGLAIDRAGNIYIADNQNNVIRMVDVTGMITTVAGFCDTTTYATGYTGDGGPATAALMNGPNSLVIDTAGNLYISDANNNVVRFVSASNGTISTYAGNGAAGYSGDGGPADSAMLSLPVGVAVSRSGWLYVADQFNDVIRSITPPPISIATATLSVCSGTGVVFNGLVTISGPVRYHWFKNNTAYPVDTANLYIDSVNNGDTVYCMLTNPASTDTFGFSNKLVMSVTSSVMPFISVSVAGSDTLCPGSPVTFTSSIANGGHTPAYVWYKNGSPFSTTRTAFVPTPSNGDIYYCALTSNAVCPYFSTVNSDSVTITVLPTRTPTIVVSTYTDTVCAGTTVSFTASVTDGGTRPSYTWFSGTAPFGSDSSGSLYIPVAGDIISCRLVSNYRCATNDTAFSNHIAMNITPHVTPSISIAAAGSDTICSGTTVTLHATAVNGGFTPRFTWRVNGIFMGVSDSFSYTPADGDIVKCGMVTSLSCVSTDSVNSDSIKLAVIGVSTPTVTTTFSADTVCYGTTITFNASGVNAGGAPVYDWFRNGTPIAVGPSYSYRATSTGDSVFCVLHSSQLCTSPDTAMSAVTHIVVNPIVTPSDSISASPAGAICAGTTVTYTVVPVNGGSMPTLIWYKNGIGVDTGYSYMLSTAATGDSIYCELVSSEACASPDSVHSNHIVMNVIPLVTPTISISITPNDTVCAGTTVTFNSSITHGGSAPAYQWKKNGTNVATDTAYSYVPTNGDVVYCVLTSSATCATPDSAVSSSITMHVNPNVNPDIIVTPSTASAVCAGDSVSFTTSVINEGSAPAYQWRVNHVNVGTGATTYGYRPSNGDTVVCKLTSNAVCLVTDSAISAPLRMMVNPIVTPSVSITISPSDTVCAGHPQTYTATAVSGGSAPSYRWYKNGVLAGFSSVYVDTPAAGDSVYCSITSNAPCRTIDTVFSNVIHPHINPILTPSISITATADTVCQGTRVAYHATVVNGGTNPIYHWKINVGYVGTDTSYYSYVPLNLDKIWCVLVSNAICVSPDSINSDTIRMRVNPMVVPAVHIISTDTICAGMPVVYGAMPDSGGTHPRYEWFVNGVATDTANPYTYTPSHTDVVSCRMISNMMCAMPDSVYDTAHVVVDSMQTPLVTISALPDTVVYSGTPVTFTAVPIYGGSATTYQWYINSIAVSGATNATFVHSTYVDGDQVTCKITSNYRCLTVASATSRAVAIHIKLGVATVDKQGISIMILPNPNGGNFTVKGAYDVVDGSKAVIYITDMMGKKIFETQTDVTDGTFSAAIAVDNNLANGMYLLHIGYGQSNEVAHFMLAR